MRYRRRRRSYRGRRSYSRRGRRGFKGLRVGVRL